jgi:putative FmdB family regulatory protein
MPTYDYHCDRCGAFEHSQSIKAPNLTACPHCGGRKISKLVSKGGGVIFKGSGFWETDYNRSNDYSSKAKADTASPAPAADKPAAAPTTAATPAATTAPPSAAPAKPGSGA